MEVSPVFFDTFVAVLLEIFYIATAFLYIYWLKPFVIKKRAVYYAAVVYWIISFIGQHTDGPRALGRLLTLLSILLPVLVLYFLDEKRNPLQKVFLCSIFSLIWWIVIEMLSELGFYERDITLTWEPVASSITAMVLYFIIYNVLYYGLGITLIFFSFRLLHKTYKRKYEELSWREFIMLLAPTSSLLVVKSIIRSYFNLWMSGMENGSIKENIPGDVFRIAFCVLSYASIIVIIVFYQQIKENQEEQYAKHALESQTEDIERHMDQIEDMYEKIRSMRHDMGNHMAVIEGLIENGEKDALNEYIGQWKKNYEEAGMPVKTGNPIIDVAISEFAGRFDKAKIPFEYSFRYPDQLQINPFDMSVVITNALQNAYEASVSAQDPAVKLTSVIRDNTFIISLKNHIDNKAYIDPEEDLPVSSKKEDGHGYGLKNIRIIARKYKGDIEIRQEADKDGYIFVLNVMFIG